MKFSCAVFHEFPIINIICQLFAMFYDVTKVLLKRSLISLAYSLRALYDW